MIATVNAAGMCIISNSFDMTGHLLKTFSRGGSEYPRLSERPEFRALVNDSLQSSDLVAWIDARHRGHQRLELGILVLFTGMRPS